jgi:glucose 1-dehydrogenase
MLPYASPNLSPDQTTKKPYPSNMKAVAVNPSQREVRLIDQPSPQLAADDQLLIRSLEVGICGTDREICSFVYGTPPEGSEYLVLGHESIGEIVEVGASVAGFRPGDLVVPTVRRACPHQACHPCRSGRQDFCLSDDFTERGIKMEHGFLTEYYLEEEKNLNFVPPELREVGVLAEPLTVTEKALVQIWQVQQRLPWTLSKDPAKPGEGLRAVVLGAGPVGILAAMAFISRGFETWVYSRSLKPNRKAELVESLGATYISTQTETPRQLAERVGRVDLVYEAVGHGKVAFDVLNILGLNGIYVFTGIPAPKPAIDFEADNLMRSMVLKNQVALGTVNAAPAEFQAAVKDVAAFYTKWPEQVRALITGRYPIDSYRELLLDEPTGIKNVIRLR